VNQLSLLLYWGNVSGNLGASFCWMGFCAFVVAIIVGIFRIISWASIHERLVDYMKYGKSDVAELSLLTKQYKQPFLALPVCLIVLTFLLWTLACFAPSQETVYAIAASELGDRALHSQVVGSAEHALEAWLNRQISPPSEKKSD
jgi:hypothetical protein